MLWIPECGREEFWVPNAAGGIPGMDSAAAAAAELQPGLCIIKGRPDLKEPSEPSPVTPDPPQSDAFLPGGAATGDGSLD